MGLVDQGLALFGIKTSVAEHADLINDVVPSTRSLKLLGQQLVKFLPHLDDTISHRLDILFPLLKQLGSVQDQSDQPRAVSWGIADLASSEDGKLTTDFICDHRGGRDDVEGANTFTVQTSVLGETLADQHWNTPSGEFPDGPGVPVQISAGETLISAVKKGVVVLLYHHVCDLTPLFPGRIYTGWVVSTGMKENDGTVRSGGNGAKELVAGEADGLGVIVLVGDRFDSDVPEDGDVIDPSGIRNIGLLGSVEYVESAEEQGCEVIGTSAGNGLDASNAFFRDRGGVITQDKTGGGGGEFWKTSDRKVFMVDGWIVQQSFSGLLDHRQHPWFGIIVSVSTDP